MPWIEKDLCVSCARCIGECPVGTIYMEDFVAVINMDNCIRCGICHKVCPEGAVRHDSEKTNEKIATNVKKAKKLMTECEKYLKSKKEGQDCLKRLIKYYCSEKTVAEKTISELKALQMIGDM